MIPPDETALMLPKRQARCDIDTLTWEYLDGVSSPTRLAQLETLLRTRKQLREQFVEQCQLHGMLHEHFKAEHTESDATPVVHAEPLARRKRRRGRSNAA